jgi:hypothetical protein
VVSGSAEPFGDEQEATIGDPLLDADLERLDNDT